MSKLIVKDNDFIEASHNLDLVEQRIILLAIIKARQESDDVEQTLGKEFVIHASEYMTAFKVERHSAYESLRNGVQGLLNAKFLYRYENKNNNLAHRGYNLASWVEYVDNEACVSIKFSPDIVPLIIGLNKKFTSYELEQIVNLQSRYAIRLYELLIRWRDKRKFIVSLEDLRFCLGIKKNEYLLMSNFKSRVLDLAIEQINEHTDIETTYSQKKEGRKIIGFEFNFIVKKESDNGKPEKLQDSEKPTSSKNRKSNLSSKLSEKEIEVIKNKADIYILEKNITEKNHKENIYKLAMQKKWGLEELKKNDDLFIKQNEEVDKKIIEDIKLQNLEKQRLIKQSQDNEEFIKLFENLSLKERTRIQNEVKILVNPIASINKKFNEKLEKGIAYKDIMFRHYFKKVMKLEH